MATLLRAALTALTLLLASPAKAQQEPAPPTPLAQPAPPLSAEAVRAAIASLESQTGLDEAARKRALDAWNEALSYIQRRDEAAGRLADFLQATSEAPGRLATIQAELAAPPPDVTPQVPPDATLAQLEQQLAQAQAELLAARQQADELQAEGPHRSERRPVISEAVSAARKQLAETDEALRSFTPSESPPLDAARRAALEARRDYLAREIEALEAELTSYDARRDLLPARRDRALRRVAQAQKLVDQWQTLVADGRRAEAEAALREAERLRRQAARQHPVLRAFAEQTEQLAALRLGETGTAQGLSHLASRLRDTQKQLSDLRDGYESIQRRIQATDLNRATGLLLRRQYEQLPASADLRREFRSVTRQLEEAEIAWIERDEQRSGAGDVSRVVDNLLDSIAQTTDGSIENRADVEAVARELAASRRDVLSNLVKDASDRFQLLLALSEASKLLLDSVVAYEVYIEERILWIRSIATDRIPTVDEIIDDVAWLVNPDAWANAIDALLLESVRHPVPLGAVAVLVAVLFLLGRLSRQHLRAMADRVTSYRTDRFALTCLAVLHTIVASLFPAAIFYSLGYLLLRPPEQAEVAVAVGTALQRTSMLVFVLVFAWNSVIARGMFDAHFRWPASTLRSIRAHLRWFIPTVLPIVILGQTIERQSGDELAATLGRTAFTAHMVVLAVLMQRLLRPVGPVMGEYHKRNTGTLLQRARYLVVLVAIAMPLALAIVSWMGYHYTALQLFTRWQHSLFLVVALILAYSLMLRWLFIARRKVAIDDARRRRELSQPDAKPTDRSADDERFDLPALSAQTQQLFRVTVFLSIVLGFYTLWASTLPALRMLDRVQVWPSIRIGQSERDTGVPILEARTQPPAAPASPAASPAPPAGADAAPAVPLPRLTPAPASTPAAPISDLVVSLADLGFALLVIGATIIAFRNIPGLVEIVVLQKLPLDAGARYALSTVLRYIIAIIGVTIAFNAIGISWGKVQWLAAALTFGLAFGLQEIFANFVSGLIILAERPIRVGDTVTVGGVSGSVTRIRMRATTITDWDRKELIIPNKSFITDQVINWTLTDPVLRIVIPVGVSYGSDVDQVESLLLRAAAQIPIIMRDPKPQALFLNFGDSTLNFELRVFIPSIEHGMPVRHQLHNTIIKLFREHGVEIAFPQRDVNLRLPDAPFRFTRIDESTVEQRPPDS